MAGKRIDTTTSRTAEIMCMIRAMSSLEKHKCYKCDDDLAFLLLPRLFQLLTHLPLFRRIFTDRMGARGMYEYVIARTKYMDAAFKEALAEGFGQVLIFGAGFDTRALRFRGSGGSTKVFELDAPATQNAKIGQYRKRGLAVPPNLTFIPIDFDRESLARKLEEAGFDRQKRTLFILEGLLMYLEPRSVDETFRTIQAFAGKGSEVVFDYIYASVLRGENLYLDEARISGTVAKMGEKWCFGIEKGEAGKFLSTYGLRLLDEKNSLGLEELYFKELLPPSGPRPPQARSHLVNGSHCLVRATKE